MADILTLVVNGRRYDGWTSIRVSRGIDRCVSDFDIEVTERWANQDLPWRILPYAPCQIYADDDLLLTGYVDAYMPSFGPRAHSVRIRGRSKTGDLVDNTPDIKVGQFNGYPLSAIAPAVCAIFGIDVVNQTDNAEMPFATVQMERCETAFSFLERLGRLCGVLLCDDTQGRLVLTTAGLTHANGSLLQGDNIIEASGTLSGEKRHSIYIVKGQRGLGAGTAGWAGAGGSQASVDSIGGTTVVTPTQSLPAVPQSGLQLQMEATATDDAVPRYRPRVVMAESQITQEQMQLRANWLRQFAFGKSTEARATVAGWRQPDGTLWQPNQLITLTSDFLGVDEDLLAARVEFQLDITGGHRTSFTLGPVEGYTPDPAEVKIRKAKGRGGKSGINWSGAGT